MRVFRDTSVFFIPMNYYVLTMCFHSDGETPSGCYYRRGRGEMPLRRRDIPEQGTRAHILLGYETLTHVELGESTQMRLVALAAVNGSLDVPLLVLGYANRRQRHRPAAGDSKTDGSGG